MSRTLMLTEKDRQREIEALANRPLDFEIDFETVKARMLAGGYLMATGPNKQLERGQVGFYSPHESWTKETEWAKDWRWLGLQKKPIAWYTYHMIAFKITEGEPILVTWMDALDNQREVKYNPIVNIGNILYSYNTLGGTCGFLRAILGPNFAHTAPG